MLEMSFGYRAGQLNVSGELFDTQRELVGSAGQSGWSLLRFAFSSLGLAVEI